MIPFRAFGHRLAHPPGERRAPDRDHVAQSLRVVVADALRQPVLQVVPISVLLTTRDRVGTPEDFTTGQPVCGEFLLTGHFREN